MQKRDFGIWRNRQPHGANPTAFLRGEDLGIPSGDAGIPTQSPACGLPAGGLWVHMPPAVTRVGAASNTPGRFNLSTLKYREQSLQGTPLRSNHHYYHYNHLAMLARLEG